MQNVLVNGGESRQRTGKNGQKWAPRQCVNNSNPSRKGSDVHNTGPGIMIMTCDVQFTPLHTPTGKRTGLRTQRERERERERPPAMRRYDLRFVAITQTQRCGPGTATHTHVWEGGGGGAHGTRGVPVFASHSAITLGTLTIHGSRFFEGTFARHAPGAPGIQINVPAIYPNALPLSYRAWGALFTIAKAQVIPA